MPRMSWNEFYEEFGDDVHDEFVSDYQDEPSDRDEEDEEEEGFYASNEDIMICLNCGHLAHYHTDYTTPECRHGKCECTEFEPEICN